MGAHEKDDTTTEESLHIDLLNEHNGKADPPPPPSFFESNRVWVLSLIDRSLRTIVQAAVGYITAVQLVAPGNFSILQFFGVVLGAAIVSVGTGIISAPSFNDSWWYQIIERAVKTFCQVFVSGIVTTSIGGVAFSVLPTGVMAVVTASGIAALTSVLNSVLSISVGAPTAVDIITPKQE